MDDRSDTRSGLADRLIEREREVDAVEAAVAAALAGRGGMVVVAGPGGIGKSLLLARGRELAKTAGLRVLGARCSELERSFPFGAARQLFERLLLADDREALLDGAAAGAAPLFEGSGPPVEGDALFARVHGLYWLVANLAAGGPLLLAVDDAHWADEASLRFLTFLAHRMGDLPAVLLVGTRPVEDPTADPAVGALITDPEAVQLRPPPLSEAAVTALLDGGAESPDAVFAAACREATGGNPFLVQELVGAIAAEGLVPRAEAVVRVRSLGPAGIATAILVRLRALAPAATDLARALAILGDSIDARTAGSFAGLEEPAAVEAAHVLETAGVVEASDGLRFVHPIVRQSVYQDLTSVERGERHLAAATFLAQRGAAPDAIASHLLHAPRRGDPSTVAALRAAADRDEALGDPIAAADHLRRAVAEPPPASERAALLLALGRSAARAGLAEAPGHLEECLALHPEPQIHLPAAEILAELRGFSGRPDLAVDVLERGIAELGEDSDEGRRLAALLITPAHQSVPARRRVLARIQRLSDPGGPARSPEELETLAALSSFAIMDRNDGPTAADTGLRALAAPLPESPDAALRGSLVVLGVALMLAEEHAGSDALLSRILDAARATGGRAVAATIASLRGLLRYRQGLVASAEADALMGLELLPQAHGAEMMAHAGVGAAVLAGIERERPQAALEAILDETTYHRDPEILPHTQILLARGTLRQVHGDHEAALTAFEACDRPGPGWGRDAPSIAWWRSGAALSLAALGREEEARALAAEEVVLARESRLPRATGVAERAAALVGPHQHRAAGLAAAAATLEPAHNPLESARTLSDLGAALRGDGERQGARDALTRAHELADRAGATRVARMARQELRTLGARPKATAGTGVASLTPAERRVAEPAAAGRTNREIAQSLFVSEKTVETHLARTFRKLELRSRRQLPDVLAQP